METPRQSSATSELDARHRQHLEALEALDKLREKFQAKYGIIEGDVLEQVSSGRDADFERVLFKEVTK